jgi:hypothetical protein
VVADGLRDRIVPGEDRRRASAAALPARCTVAQMPKVLQFDAALADFPEVTRAIEVREDQTLVDLHRGIQAAFGWLDDHIYSFWLDGEFWGSPATEYTAAVEVEDDLATADIALSRLGLKEGAKIAYAFDFGDSWRVSLRLDARIDDEGVNYPRVAAAEGDAPPQYPAPDEISCWRWLMIARRKRRGDRRGNAIGTRPTPRCWSSTPQRCLRRCSPAIRHLASSSA